MTSPPTKNPAIPAPLATSSPNPTLSAELALKPMTEDAPTLRHMDSCGAIACPAMAFGAKLHGAQFTQVDRSLGSVFILPTNWVTDTTATSTIEARASGHPRPPARRTRQPGFSTS